MPELSIESMSNNFSTSEIEEEWCLDAQHHGIPETILEEDEGSGMSWNDYHGRNTGKEGDDIYVAVGKSSTSMDALMWALKHLVKPSSSSNSFLYLVHVFPEVHQIPTPCKIELTFYHDAVGKFPKEQLGPDQVETYMVQERSKRRELVQKFLNLCSTTKVNVDTVLIESDNTAKAVLDLIPILNIKNLVVGTSKSSVRKLEKRGGIANQIVKNAPESCEVRIIFEGKELSPHMLSGASTPQVASGPSTPQVGDITAGQVEEEQNQNTFSSCACFTRKFI